MVALVHYTHLPKETTMTTVERATHPATDETSPFDAIKQTRPDGSEFWSARAIQVLMGYVKWQRFEDAIARAKVSTANCGRDSDAEFVQVTQLTDAGNLGTQERKDYELSRYAAYTLAMNGEPSKPEVALAQGYFINQTWFAEAVQENPALLAPKTDDLSIPSPYEVGTLYSETLDEFKRVITPETADTPTAYALTYAMQTWAQVMAHQVIGDAFSVARAPGDTSLVVKGMEALPPLSDRNGDSAASDGTLPPIRISGEVKDAMTWDQFAREEKLDRCGSCASGLSSRIKHHAERNGLPRGRTVNRHNLFPRAMWEEFYAEWKDYYAELHIVHNHNGGRA